MKTFMAIFAYFLSLGIIVTLFIVLAWHFTTVPVCLSKQNCGVDDWSVAGFAATIAGIFAAVLSVVAAVAVAGWWLRLNSTVDKRVEKRLKTRLAQFDPMLKTTEDQINEQKRKASELSALLDELRDQQHIEQGQISSALTMVKDALTAIIFTHNIEEANNILATAYNFLQRRYLAKDMAKICFKKTSTVLNEFKRTDSVPDLIQFYDVYHYFTMGRHWLDTYIRLFPDENTSSEELKQSKEWEDLQRSRISLQEALDEFEKIVKK